MPDLLVARTRLLAQRDDFTLNPIVEFAPRNLADRSARDHPQLWAHGNGREILARAVEGIALSRNAREPSKLTRSRVLGQRGGDGGE